MKAVIWGVALACIITTSSSIADVYVPERSDIEQEIPFKRGQQWSYEHRAQDQGSSVLILKVERYPGMGEVVHIAVQDVRFGLDGTGRSANTRDVEHLPVLGSVLRRSLSQMEAMVGDLPIIDAGYTRWRQAYAEGRAQPFSQPLQTILQRIDDQISGADGGD